MASLSYPNIFICLSICYISTTSIPRTITGTWPDDFADDSNSPLPGWSYSDNRGTFTSDPITNGILTYHGPYPASSIGEMTDDTYTISQLFYCNELSDVTVTYHAYYCDTESSDWLKLTLDGTTYTSPSLAVPAPSPDYNDAALSSATTCSTWETTGLLGPYTISDVDINTLFSVTFVSRTSQGDEAIALSQIEITCNPLNINPPTTQMPTTAQPTTHTPTTTAPTNIPTTPLPTTNIPTTNAPSTAIPTTNMPTTSLPTTSLPTTDMPTTDMPTTNVPTAVPTAMTSTSMATTVMLSTYMPTNVATAAATTGKAADSGIISISSTFTTSAILNTGNGRSDLPAVLDQSNLIFLFMGFVIPLFLCALICFLCLMVKKGKKNAKLMFRKDKHHLSQINNTINIRMTSTNNQSIRSLSSDYVYGVNQSDAIGNLSNAVNNNTNTEDNTPPTGTDDNDGIIAIGGYETFGKGNDEHPVHEMDINFIGNGEIIEIIIDEEVTVGIDNIPPPPPPPPLAQHNESVVFTAEGF